MNNVHKITINDVTYDIDDLEKLIKPATEGTAGQVLAKDENGNNVWVTLDLGDTYTAGEGINIDNNNVISATDTTYTAGNGITIVNDTISVDTEVVASKEYVDGLVGDINTLLDTINGEVI